MSIKTELGGIVYDFLGFADEENLRKTLSKVPVYWKQAIADVFIPPHVFIPPRSNAIFHFNVWKPLVLFCEAVDRGLIPATSIRVDHAGNSRFILSSEELWRHARRECFLFEAYLNGEL